MAKAPRHRVVRACRLVRCLIRAEPDTLLATPDLCVESLVRKRVHTAVPGARSAAGRHHGGAAREVRLS
jgi:hypothetical protein